MTGVLVLPHENSYVSAPVLTCTMEYLHMPGSQLVLRITW